MQTLQASDGCEAEPWVWKDASGTAWGGCPQVACVGEKEGLVLEILVAACGSFYL